MESEGFWLLVHLMAGVRATHADEHVVFGSKVRGNLSLPFAAVLSTDQHIDDSFVPPPVKSQMASGSNKHVQFGVSARVNDDIRFGPEFWHLAFRLILQNVFIGLEFLNAPRLTLLVSTS